MHKKGFNVQFILKRRVGSLHCLLHSVECNVCCMQCAVSSEQFAVFSFHCAESSVYFTVLFQVLD